ncbi:hypothetical protein RB195_012920 [Necator americanus]|uniref:RecQ-mediated genome instability protein 1 n=1 Tax=Necator americanus TaxID=51031 RepID=A0ABR1DT56_NECAM
MVQSLLGPPIAQVCDGLDLVPTAASTALFRARTQMYHNYNRGSCRFDPTIDYMVDSLSFIFDFFAERHIALKEEWLVDVTTFLLSTFEAEQSLPRIAGLVFEQWKYSDLKESSYPTFSQLNLDSADVKFSFNHPLVLQINSIVDIGAPFHFQFTALVSEFIDDTGFDPLPEMEQERYSNVLAASQRRMLLLTLSDGESDFRAIEYKSIKQLSLLLKPGCKVLLIPPVRCRKGILFLKPENIQIIGGDVESLFETGRPLQIITKKMNEISPDFEVKKKKQTKPHIHSSNSAQRDSNSSSEKPCGGANMPKVSSKEASNLLEGTMALDVADNRLFLSDTMHNEHQCTRPKPVAQVSPMYPTSRRASLESKKSFSDSDDKHPTKARSGAGNKSTSAIEIKDTKTTAVSPAPSVCNPDSLISVKGSSAITERSSGDRDYLQTQSSSAMKRSKENKLKSLLTKKFTPEIVKLEDSDSECQVVGTSSPVTTPPAYATQILPQTSQAAEDALIAKFRALNVVRLAEACRLMRFTVGSCRKIVQGIVVDIVGSLRIVDGMWTMKVTVQDESIDKLMCLVDNRLLTSLIGLTPKEAMEIRSSSDIGRRQDGQRRLAAVEAQLKRLDLLLELELFSSGRADPIIRSIQTLVQALDVL